MPRLASWLFLLFWLTTLVGGTGMLSAAQTPATPALNEPQRSRLNPGQLQQLVAPIALYPDSLVAQILTASTYPEQVVGADRWLHAHSDLKGATLGKAVDAQTWDPSVKALTAFPSILGNMDKNLSWTSSLGDAYYNQDQEVMDAVQVMRKRAQDAGNLRTTPQQTISGQGSTLTIEPANPDLVYVPEYDPWSIYGLPMAAWPGWYEYPGIWYGGPNLSFGIGFGIGFFGGFEWGWPRWGFDWHNRYAMYNHSRYRSRSNTFYNRNNFYRGGGNRTWARPGGGTGNRPAFGNPAGRAALASHPFGTSRAFSGAQNPRGSAEPQGRSGSRPGAFSGYEHGGQTRGFASRGGSSLGGGAARGGGAPRGGGAGRGGPRR